MTRLLVTLFVAVAFAIGAYATYQSEVAAYVTNYSVSYPTYNPNTMTIDSVASFNSSGALHVYTHKLQWKAGCAGSWQNVATRSGSTAHYWGTVSRFVLAAATNCYRTCLYIAAGGEPCSGTSQLWYEPA